MSLVLRKLRQLGRPSFYTSHYRPFDCLSSTPPLPIPSSSSFRLDPVGHSGPLGPWLFLVSSPFLVHFGVLFSAASTQSVIPAHSVSGFFFSFSPPSLLDSFLSCLGPVGHSGPLGLWLPPLFLSPSPIQLFHNCLDPVGHSGPLGPWLFLVSSPFLVHFGVLFSAASTQSVIPAHSVSGFFFSFSPPSLLGSFLSCLGPVGHSGPLGLWLPPLFLSPSPIQLFHNCLDPVGHSGPLGPWLFLVSSPFLVHFGVLFSAASTQSVIPAHSVSGFFFSFSPPSLLGSFLSCLGPVGHSGPLGLWLPPLFLSPSPIQLFHNCLDPVGHSGPLGPWLFLVSSPFLVHFGVLFSAASTQSVIPAHSVSGFFFSFSPPSLLGSFLSCLGPVGHSGPLGLWLPPLFLSPSPIQLFHNCLDPVGHSGPLGLWLPPWSSLCFSRYWGRSWGR